MTSFIARISLIGSFKFTQTRVFEKLVKKLMKKEIVNFEPLCLFQPNARATKLTLYKRILDQTLKLFTSYDFLIFVSLNYTFNVLANLNSLVDFYQILYHTFLNVITCMCKDLVSLVNYFKNRNGKYIEELKKFKFHAVGEKDIFCTFFDDLTLRRNVSLPLRLACCR